MTIYDRIKELALAKHISVAELERKLGFSNGSLYKWSKTSPSIDKVKLVADYFHVSTDYLLGRTKDVEDPISYFRIDTAGLDEGQVSDMKNQLTQYQAFLKEQLMKKNKK